MKTGFLLSATDGHSGMEMLELIYGIHNRNIRITVSLRCRSVMMWGCRVPWQYDVQGTVQGICRDPFIVEYFDNHPLSTELVYIDNKLMPDITGFAQCLQ